ncbi:hypothetical protein Tco_0761684 [Tanacetum coccineum]
MLWRSSLQFLHYNLQSKSKFMEHVGVASWFRRLCNAQSDFAAKERIVWVDIEGVPLNAWTRSTFQKISSKWGELVELEDGYADPLLQGNLNLFDSVGRARSNSRGIEEAENSVDRVSLKVLVMGLRYQGRRSNCRFLEEMITVVSKPKWGFSIGKVAFPLISAICLDRHLSDHRPILLKEVFSDFGPTPFRFYHSWLELPGFDDLVSKSWNSFTLDDSNDVQTAFLPNRQILDGPFIINEILARCKLKKQQAMIFKVDFAKAYDSVRWDYLDDVLISLVSCRS